MINILITDILFVTQNRFISFNPEALIRSIFMAQLKEPGANK